MFWVLKRTVPLKWFLWVPTTLIWCFSGEIEKEFEITLNFKSILRDFRNAPFYIHCLFHMIDLRMFSLSYFILLQNKQWSAMISICSCCSFWHNIDVSVFQQLSSEKCEFDLIWKQTLSGGSRSLNKWKNTKVFRNNRFITLPRAAFLY